MCLPFGIWSVLNPNDPTSTTELWQDIVYTVKRLGMFKLKIFMRDHLDAYLEVRDYRIENSERSNLLNALAIAPISAWKSVYEEPDLMKRIALAREQNIIVTSW